MIWLKSATSRLVLLAVFTIILLVGCSNEDRIIIGTQTYSEPKILAQMHKLLIEDRTGLKVDVLPDLASSAVVAQAMKNNDIQMAVLYTGMIFDNYFPVEPNKDRDIVFQQAKEGFDKHYGFHWFDPYGFENTYAFTVREDVASQGNLANISDVGPMAGNMSLGVDTTWLERENDGYPAFRKHYGFAFGKTLPMEVALVYKAVASKNVDIVLAYSTDPRIKEYNLQSLKDDKQFFPPYDAAPVIRNDVLAQHPELNEITSLLAGKIDVQTMIELNYEVDVSKRNERKVAEEYLKKVGLLN
ncbi:MULTISPECIES: glycine betaine ABC transporter substrate-binding protein [unclassified Paenibacillus]|uniref:glycine betaine ABC transporter substrate-binding protein n=1 Tax=unclassified Paenibacillus TaxID=185978 RepID=UPI001AE969BE|nr:MULTISPECIES: glycine betaine ABC transporter substrate-binding protein [unclassified Paenibacillus]MBP1155795.1 osmoprotectant transport system substrate-binding protein [Paenibacillus sp. PvP091]MBP1168819.1 osmoprotectant transport system substrate-binding protein [Paenibacillus sp. PvR098]MBP2439847.1 osmoprotectant transport system substrate-binding protein [Paenibacillus sp. PvP052]